MASNTQLAPFRNNTRQRWAKVLPSASIAFGSTAQIPFPQVGLMSRIFLFVQGSIVDSAATPNTPASTFGPFNLLKRITGTLNLGTSNVFDLSGYGSYMVEKVSNQAVDFKFANTDQSTDNFYQYPSSLVQNVAKVINFVVMIPVNANDGPQFAVGLINLQAPELRFNLNLTFGLSADIFPGSTTSATQTLSGTVTCYYQYYEVPDPDEVALPARVMHRLLEDRTPVLATGDTTYLVPRQGVALQIMHNVILNGVIDKSSPLNGNVSGRRLVFNKTDTAYNVDPIVDRIVSRLRYGLSAAGIDIPSGMYIWDLWDGDMSPSSGDLRDAIDTEALSTLESIITIATGATLGSNNNFIDTVRRVMQQY